MPMTILMKKLFSQLLQMTQNDTDIGTSASVADAGDYDYKYAPKNIAHT